VPPEIGPRARQRQPLPDRIDLLRARRQPRPPHVDRELEAVVDRPELLQHRRKRLDELRVIERLRRVELPDALQLRRHEQRRHRLLHERDGNAAVPLDRHPRQRMRRLIPRNRPPQRLHGGSELVRQLLVVRDRVRHQVHLLQVQLYAM
jgi:hypothetical protein